MKWLLITIILLTGCANYTLNGIPLDRFKTSKDWIEGLLGWTSSLLIHMGSHILYLELIDADYKIENQRERIFSDLTNAQWRWEARIGFVGQLTCGTIIKLTPLEQRPYATGYYMASAFEVITYPIRYKKKEWGDFYVLEKYGGNAQLEWLGYSTWAIGLLITNKGSE